MKEKTVNPLLGYVSIVCMFGCAVGFITYVGLLIQFWGTNQVLECIGWLIVFGFSFIFLWRTSIYKHAQEHHNNFKETIKNRNYEK